MITQYHWRLISGKDGTGYMTTLKALFEIAPELEGILARAENHSGDEAYERFKQQIDQTLERLGRRAPCFANPDREWLLSSAPTGARQIAVTELTMRLGF